MSDKTALFNDLQKGLNITSGLKKTDKAAHKNAPPVAQPTTSAKRVGAKLTKPDGEPSTTVEGSTVFVENYGGSRDEYAQVKLDSQYSGKTVYIQNCEFATVTLTGVKTRCLTVENCKKVL